MKNIFSLFLSIALSSNTAISQINVAIKLSTKVFKSGIAKAGIFYMDFPPEIKSLQEKAIANLNKYPEWKGRGIIYMIKDGDQHVKYMDEMGLSKEEFNKMFTGFKQGKQRYVTDTVQIRISIANDIISFSTKGKLAIINPLIINLRTKKIQYDCWISTKEFFRTNDIFNVGGLEGSEVHLDRTKNPKKVKDNLVGFTIYESLIGEKGILNFMFINDNFELGDKPKNIWVVIF